MKIIYSLFVLYFICIINLINAEDNYCEALKYSLLFYKVQRAGRLPDNFIPWRSNSVLKDTYQGQYDDKGDGILSKGYFDAGDGVKFGFPQAYSMSMLGWSYLVSKSNIENCGLDSLYKDVLKWGSDFNIACHISDNVFVGQIADGNTDHNFWGPPENITYTRNTYIIDSNNPGTDLAMEAATSLAIASMVFSSDSSYSTKCLNHAKTLYNFAWNSNKKVYSQSITGAAGFYSSNGYNDEIAWASVWLYKATNDQTYLSNAVSYYQNNDFNSANELSWDQKGVAVSLLLYQIKGEQSYKTNLENALNYWKKGGGVSYTPGGLAYLRQWGPCRYALNMAFIAAMYGKPGDDYTTFAKSQLSYVLGNNPQQRSFVLGWGTNYPKNPHHRASHHSETFNIDNPIVNTYVLYGGLVGGPDNNDGFYDYRNNTNQSEVALDYNVGLVGTLSIYSAGCAAASDINPYGGSLGIDFSSDYHSSSDFLSKSESGSTNKPSTTPNTNSYTNLNNTNSENSDIDSIEEINDSISIHKLSFLLLVVLLLINTIFF